MIKSDDKLHTVIYRYGDDGQRALKFTQQSNSETLYFNNFYSVHQVAHEPNHEHGLRVSKHIFVGNSRLVTALTHADNHGDTTEQTEKRYYYHADHLQSAQFITNAKGEQYEHIEYTPYGELWIEETAPGIDKLPFRFTGKELDEETGLYYYGARYLDPKYSRWLSGDPALNDYIPKAPIDDEAKKHNENLPGMGGVFNVVNLHVYHYAGNNPIKYTDPDGRQQVHPGIQALNDYFDQVERTNAFVEDSMSFIYDNILTKGSAFGQYIDKVFYKGAGEKKAFMFYLKIMKEFVSIKFEIKSNMINNKIIEPNENGKFSMEDADVFARAVNETIVFNYSDRSELFPYIVDLPELTVDDAYNYLNTVLPDLNIILPKLIKDE